jgi:integrase
MRGTGISKRDWWTSLILFLLDVGCRKESALLLRPEEIDLDACTARLRWENDKTSIESWRRFSGQTADWVRSHYSLTRARVWPYPYHRRQVWIQFKRILKAANLPHDRYRMFHCFRRTNATYATANGSLELARQQMGHTSLEMTLRYVDPRLLNGQQAVDVLPRPKLPRKN